MFGLVRNSIQDFTLSYKKYLSFALLYVLLTSFLFVPLISFIFNRMLKIIGSGSLLNAEVYKIPLSIPGMSALFMIAFIVVVILLVEFGVMIVIAQQRYFNQSIFLSNALVTTLRKVPNLLGIGFLQFLLLMLFIIPFIDLPVMPALLDFNLTIFITNQFYGASTFFMVLYIVVLVLAIFLFIRWIFVLHYIFIEKKSIWEALKLSWELTKYNKLKIIFYLCLVNLLIFVIGFLFVTFLSAIPGMVDTFMGDIVRNYLITFSSFITFTLSIFLMPMNIIMITRLFYLFKKNKGDLIDDQLAIHESKKLIILENKIILLFAKRRMALSTIIILVVTGIFVINDTLNDNIVYLKWNVQVAAHRGDSFQAPENSISSIRSAIEKGVDAVEIDVMLTKDGVVILNHDPTLQRVAGVPRRVNEMTFEEVSQVDIGRRFSDKFIGERIPTLDEVLELMKEEDVTLIIDLKPLDSSNELAEKVVDLIEKHEMEDVVYVQAFENHLLQAVRKRNSEIKIGQVLYLAAGNLADLDVDFYTIRQTMLSDRFIRNARAQNREVWVWTINRERDMKEVLKYDIDGVLTGRPEMAQTIIGIDFAQR